jgi:1-deoxy-D-xylulose-5-phosphate synthase
MDIGFLRMMPNMLLAAPANEIEMKLVLEFALSENKPVCIRYPKDLVPPELGPEIIKACAEPFKAGKCIIIREALNSSVAIVAYGSVLNEAVKAAEILADEGVMVDVINTRFASPIDEKIISLLAEGKSIITVEDHNIACGFGSGVLESAAATFTKSIPRPIVTLGVPARFIRHSSRNSQLAEIGINAEKIAETVRKFAKKQQKSTKKYQKHT